MLRRLEKVLLSLILFFGVTLDNFAQITMTKDTVTCKVEQVTFKDSSLIKEINSIIIRDSLCINNRPFHVYNVVVDGCSINSLELDISLMPLSGFDVTKSVGYVEYNNSLFFLTGHFSNNLIERTEKNDVFLFFQYYTDYGDGRLIPYPEMISYSSWILTYNDNQLKEYSKSCVQRYATASNTKFYFERSLD